MKLSIGIVGLPNVGKSTLFNTLTNNSVPAENYPFCTIDPNVGIVAVPDVRLEKLAEIVKSEKIIPAVVEFVDIAGLVKGAHKGEGLGNQFLANIREVSAIVHVVREFVDNRVVHVSNRIDPKDDIEIINAELILRDLETIEEKMKKLGRQSRFDEKSADQLTFITALKAYLESGELANRFHYECDWNITNFRKELFLITDKPVIYLINVSDIKEERDMKKNLGLKKDDIVMQMDIKTEFEISRLNKNEREEFIKELGLEEPALNKLIRETYKILGLLSFFTVGPKEVRAWTIKKGDNIKEAGAAIHNDFKDKFIAAEVIGYEDFIKYKGWEAGKRAGKVRSEGKNYIVKDGDVVIFKHGA